MIIYVFKKKKTAEHIYIYVSLILIEYPLSTKTNIKRQIEINEHALVKRSDQQPASRHLISKCKGAKIVVILNLSQVQAAKAFVKPMVKMNRLPWHQEKTQLSEGENGFLDKSVTKRPRNHN